MPEEGVFKGPGHHPRDTSKAQALEEPGTTKKKGLIIGLDTG